MGLTAEVLDVLCPYTLHEAQRRPHPKGGEEEGGQGLAESTQNHLLNAGCQ